MVYYNCPMLCTQVLNGLTRSLKPLALDVGKDFDVIVVSIDPNEKPDLSALKKRLHLEQYDREGTEAGWHFLTGDQASITTAGPDDRLSLHLQPQDPAFRPCRGNHAGDSAGPGRPLSLRARLSASRPPVRPGGGLGRQDWFADRSRSLAVLRLRRGEREVHVRDHADHARPGFLDVPDSGRRRVVAVSS